MYKGITWWIREIWSLKMNLKVKYKGNSLPPLCLETHKHMGTTFQGTQIPTVCSMYFLLRYSLSGPNG